MHAHVHVRMPNVNGKVAPVARSYDGSPWEASIISNPVELKCSDAVCTVSLSGDAHDTFRIDVHSRRVEQRSNSSAARLLIQSTFGPTRSSVAQLFSATPGSPTLEHEVRDVKAWLASQMALRPTLHRAYYRQRTNARLLQSVQPGGIRSACEAGSRWLRFAFTQRDLHKTIDVSNRGGAFVLKVDGVVRSEVSKNRG